VMYKKLIILTLIFISSVSVADSNGYICATEKTLSDMKRYGFSNEYIMINHGTTYLLDSSKIYYWGLSSEKWISHDTEMESNYVSWSNYSNAMEEMSYHKLNLKDLTLSSNWGQDADFMISKCMKTSWNNAMRVAKNWIPLGKDDETNDTLYFYKGYKQETKLGQTFRIYKMLQVYSTAIDSSKSQINYLQTFCDDKSKVFLLEVRYCPNTTGDKCEDRDRVWKMVEDLPRDSFFRKANDRICDL